MAEKRSARRNPFGISENDSHFDELLAEAAQSDVGEIDITKSLQWLAQWNQWEISNCEHDIDPADNICKKCGAELFWWYCVVKDDSSHEISMGCGRLIVQAVTEKEARAQMIKKSKNWDDQHIGLLTHGPFKTKDEAEDPKA